MSELWQSFFDSVWIWQASSRVGARMIAFGMQPLSSICPSSCEGDLIPPPHSASCPRVGDGQRSWPVVSSDVNMDAITGRRKANVFPDPWWKVMKEVVSSAWGEMNTGISVTLLLHFCSTLRRWDVVDYSPSARSTWDPDRQALEEQSASE